MAKITLNNVVSVQNTSVINDNFQKIATQLNDLVLYRDVPTGEPNQLNNPLDANGERIYNLPEPVNVLPSSTGRANRLLSFDSSGNPVCIFTTDVNVRDMDLYFNSSSIGIVLRAPNSSYFRLKVDNSGVLSTEAL